MTLITEVSLSPRLENIEQSPSSKSVENAALPEALELELVAAETEYAVNGTAEQAIVMQSAQADSLFKRFPFMVDSPPKNYYIFILSHPRGIVNEFNHCFAIFGKNNT